MNGDTIAKKLVPAHSPKSPDIYAFQQGETPPLHVIECKYNVQQSDAQSGGEACSVRDYVVRIEEKFAHANDFMRIAFPTSSVSKYVVFSQEVAPVVRGEMEDYRIELGMRETWKICDTIALRGALEKAGVQH